MTVYDPRSWSANEIHGISQIISGAEGLRMPSSTVKLCWLLGRILDHLGQLFVDTIERQLDS